MVSAPDPRLIVRLPVVIVALLAAAVSTEGAVQPSVPRLVVGKPVQMERMIVSATLASVIVRTHYEVRNNEEARLTSVVVDEVRLDSRAAKAGIEKGMQIIAIGGQPIRGLTEADFNAVMAQEITDRLELTVRRRYSFRSTKIVIPVGAPVPIKD